MDSEKKLAHELFQIYFLYNKKDLLKLDTPTGEVFGRSAYEVMFLLDDLGERPMSVVAKTLSYSKAYITSIADTLHSKGYLRRAPSREDRRVILLSLTEEGCTFLHAHRESVELAVEKRLSMLSLDDVTLMSEMAAEMVRILSKLPDSADARYIRRPAERRSYMTQVTTKYFPVHIDAPEKMPEEFAADARPYWVDRPFPYCVFIPGFVSNGITYNAVLMILDEQALTVLEHQQDTLRTTRMPIQDIIFLERGCVLLYSWLDLKANVNGTLTDCRIEFNSAREDLMQPIIDSIRDAYNPPTEIPGDSRESISFLKETDLRFYNYAGLSLLPGRSIEKVIYQPEITQPLMHLFRKSVQDAHVTLIGPNEFIDIEEAGRVEAAGTRSQGAVWRYIPRKAIHGSALTEGTEPNTVELQLEEEAGYSTAFVYTAERKAALEAYLTS